MHRVSCIHIENFRACRNITLPLDSYTPLVGQNNAGKSTILEAIRWVLKPSNLKSSDFYDEEKPVSVAACIDGIDSEVLDRIPHDRHRQAIEPYCRDGRLWIRVTATNTRSKDQEVWSVDECPQDGVPEHWQTYPTGLPQAVSALLPEPLHVLAMHDIGEDLGKAKTGTTIKGLLDEIMKPLLAAHDELTTALDTIRNVLTTGGEQRSDHLQQFDTSATDALESFFPGLALDLDLQVVDIKEFFKAGDLHVTDMVSGDRRRFDQMGTGAQRAIQMALIRYLADVRRAEDDQLSRRLLLIDEPELYLHPQGVRRLREALKTLSSAGFQVIFSTHSPLMLSRDNAPNTVIVGNTVDDGVTARKPLNQAVQDAIEDAESQSQTLFELGNLVDIYFADRVILCEGKTDRRLLPLAYEQLYQRSPDLDHITFVSVGGCNNFAKALSILSAMDIRACAIADLDFAYTNARKSGLLERDGADMAAAKATLRRLRPEHGFTLSGNGLPQKCNQWSAADIWACFASDDEGQDIAQGSHETLKDARVWAWPQGCIEQVTGADDKGEDAIMEQEQQLRAMSAAEIEQQMPAFKACFDWIRSL
ncbi:ATP-dependent nuclease [Halomonas caseinilytica]|uniref:Predicted ATP-dependent endonuclease of the OLD family, contains P-loop ATPase and TOPRIM domains n=1 Tax=Halomonas caseinilytica TaxID=438744 RepID=A0A1M6MLQ0_9GAMM|nr:AAA family ATPase [Halomonas caseinilytica]SHJ84379.1 Predicted ATP-dependent endonuclease of the OLD family, contains P-loop ATPase and TOPRIM domains [Halomonas caseinilytica]